MLKQKHQEFLIEQAAKQKIENNKKAREIKKIEDYKNHLALIYDMSKELNDFCEFLKEQT